MKNILKVRNKESTTANGKLVGAMISRQVTDYLSLYALAQRMSKSMIVRALIDDWYIDKREEQTVDDLINKIVEYAFIAWEEISIQSPRISFVEFGRDLKRDLDQKGISEIVANLIIKKVRDEAEKETR